MTDSDGGNPFRGGDLLALTESELDLFQFENLSAIPGVVHAVSTRAGGVSEGRCESLNVSYSVGDSSENVAENLRRVAEAVGARRDDLFAAYQVHGREVTVVEAETAPR